MTFCWIRLSLILIVVLNLNCELVELRISDLEYTKSLRDEGFREIDWPETCKHNEGASLFRWDRNFSFQPIFFDEIILY